MSTRESKPETCKAALTVAGAVNEQGEWFYCDNPHPNHETHFNKRLKARWVAAVVAVFAAATLSTGVAKAGPLDDYTINNAPTICSMLADNPTVAGIENIGMSLFEEGLTGEQAGEVVARSIVGWCPQYGPVLQQFIAKWTRAGQVHA